MARDLAAHFRELHTPGSPLLMPNPWNAGAARILQHLGFRALATTSSGCASAMGRLDGAVAKDETLTQAAEIVAATDVPVSADLVNGFAGDPGGVAETVRDAVAVGLAGCSIEDFTGDEGAPIYDRGLAVERVSAAVAAAHDGGRQFVLTARAENLLHGVPDLADTIARLQAFQEAGADVLFAPGLTAAADIAALVSSVDRPVNVLLTPDGPAVAELAALGVSRISVGGTFAYAAFGALVEAAQQLLSGEPAFWERARRGREVARAAFGAAPE